METESNKILLKGRTVAISKKYRIIKSDLCIAGKI